MVDVKRWPLVLTKTAATIPRDPKVSDRIRDTDLALVIGSEGFRVIKDRNGPQRDVSAADARVLLDQASN